MWKLGKEAPVTPIPCRFPCSMQIGHRSGSSVPYLMLRVTASFEFGLICAAQYLELINDDIQPNFNFWQNEPKGSLRCGLDHQIYGR